MNLEKIDTSYWLTKDKDWKVEREKQWPAIEKMVGLNLKKAEVNVVKAYFLRGKLPKWEKYRNIHEGPRPLHLSYFLWLHPSSDPEVLKPLYRSYMESESVHPQDLILGYSLFIGHELTSSTSSKKALKDYEYPYLGKKNIILFRVMFENVDYVKNCICNLIDKQGGSNNYVEDIDGGLGYAHFTRIWHWLLQKESLQLMLNCLYQYDDVLEWCITALNDEAEKKFLKIISKPVNLVNYQKALYCIYHFDEEKQEDSCRSRALVKVRQLLDENDFVPEFKQMWEGIKSGEIEVKDPWKRR